MTKIRLGFLHQPGAIGMGRIDSKNCATCCAFASTGGMAPVRGIKYTRIEYCGPSCEVGMQLKDGSALEREIAPVTKLQISIWLIDSDNSLKMANVVYNRNEGNAETARAKQLKALSNK